MTEFTTLTITFNSQQAARAVLVSSDEDPARALAVLNLPPFDGIIVVHGGASKMEEDLVTAVRRFVVAGLAPLAQERRLLIVDGGTHIGASQLMGEARQQTGGSYPLLGVVPYRFASYPGGPAAENERVPLSPDHSHFIFVTGMEFGVESRLLVGLLRASGKPGVALIINGGDIVLKEVLTHAEQGNRIVTLAGSGRIADCLADPARRNECNLPTNARLWVVNVNAPEQAATLLKSLLDSPQV
jgi:hypothetical protein